MIISSLRPNVSDLQKDALDLLSDIEDLMPSVSSLLADDGFGEKYRRFQEEISIAKDNVENLELVMAVVAPMKAGKSTIINAIAGQDILPSRASAMTTLPTRIQLHFNANEPNLKLDEETFSRTLAKLQEKIQLDGEDHAVAKTAIYPHLSELIPKIKRGFSIKLETDGAEVIKETLTDLNDIIRVCTVLDPQSNPLEQDDFDIPCISTPFWKATDMSQAKSMGNLVIVDTPGPNEAGENLRLSMVVEEQLRKSSIVVVVLDFTQLNNKAAEEVKRQVEPVIRLIGKENLYFLVNKVDQRTEQDPMTPEEVRKVVQNDIHLGTSSDAERVFEVAARWAFCAASFLSEIQHNPGIKKEEMKTARALAQQVFGIDWKDDFGACSLEQLQEKAQKLWDKSGFKPFLENAISVLIENAAPKSIKSALNLSQKYLEELRNDVLLRSSAIDKSEKELRTEIDALDKKLKEIELIRKDLMKKVDVIKRDLQEKISKLLEVLKQEARMSLEDYLFRKEVNSISSDLDSFRKKLRIDLEDLEIFTDSITSRFQYLRKSSDTFEFDNKYEAERFVNQAVAYSQQRIERFLATSREAVSQEIEKSRQDLKIFLERETSPILKEILEHLNKSFEITLSMPSFTLEMPDNRFISRPHIARKTREVYQGYKDVKTKKTDISSLFGLLPVYSNEQIKLPNKEEACYSVSLSALIPDFNRSTEVRIFDFEKNLHKYIDNDFQKIVDHVFGDLDAYLKTSKDSLIQSQKDQQLVAEKKQELVNTLGSTVSRAAEQMEKCRAHIEKAESLIPIQKTDKG